MKREIKYFELRIQQLSSYLLSSRQGYTMQDLKHKGSVSSPPPEYRASEVISTTKSDFTLSIPSKSYHPGESLRLTLSAPPSALTHVVGDIECTLEGTSTVELMGKKRYQVSYYFPDFFWNIHHRAFHWRSYRVWISADFSVCNAIERRYGRWWSSYDNLSRISYIR